MFIKVLVLEFVCLLLEEGADGEGDRGEVVQPRRQVRLAGRPTGPLVLPVKAASPDGKKALRNVSITRTGVSRKGAVVAPAIGLIISLILLSGCKLA